MKCKTCGMPKTQHNYRHLFVPELEYRQFWAEWDDTGLVVLWADGQKFKLTTHQAAALASDLDYAVDEDERAGR